MASLDYFLTFPKPCRMSQVMTSLNSTQGPTGWQHKPTNSARSNHLMVKPTGRQKDICKAWRLYSHRSMKVASLSTPEVPQDPKAYLAEPSESGILQHSLAHCSMDLIHSRDSIFPPPTPKVLCLEFTGVKLFHCTTTLPTSMGKSKWNWVLFQKFMMSLPFSHVPGEGKSLQLCLSVFPSLPLPC